MKILTASAVLIAALTPAHAGHFIWRGTAVITSSSGTCERYTPTGSLYSVRFQPRGLADNGPNAMMSWFANDYAMSFATNNTDFGATAQAVTFRSIYTGDFSPTFPVKVAFTSGPGALTGSEKDIHMAGVIYGFDFMQKCNVKFNISLVRSIEGGG